MTLDELIRTIVASDATAWHVADHGGHTYLDRFGQVSTWAEGEERVYLEHDSHHTRAIFKPDIDIGMAWGLRRDTTDEFHEDWLERFADPKAWAAWLDLLYRGQLVDRRLYVIVDGGRCMLPLPEQLFAKNFGLGGPNEMRLWVREDGVRLMRLVNEIGSGNVEYERYLRQAGFDVSPADP